MDKNELCKVGNIYNSFKNTNLVSGTDADVYISNNYSVILVISNTCPRSTCEKRLTWN